jgi:hypothetical protein
MADTQAIQQIVENILQVIIMIEAGQHKVLGAEELLNLYIAIGLFVASKNQDLVMR